MRGLRALLFLLSETILIDVRFFLLPIAKEDISFKILIRVFEEQMSD